MTNVVSEIGMSVGNSIELALLVKATLMLLVAITLLSAIPRARASARYLVVAAAFGALLLLPVAAALMAPIEFEVVRPAEPPATAALVPGTVVPEDPPGRAGGFVPMPPATHAAGAASSFPVIESIRRQPLHLFRVVWLAGGLVFAALVLRGLWRARALRRTAVGWPDGEVLARELADDARIKRTVQVLRHEGVPAPMTCGVVRPAVLLPWDASDWTEAEVRQALIHELEHVRRRDWPAHILAQLVCAAYWFHPMVWMAWRHLHLEAERACDDAVVRRVESAAYAEQLIRLAERMSGRDVGVILAMARGGDLSVRVRSVLDARRARNPAGVLWTYGATAAALLSLVAIAPLRAVAVEGVGDRFLPSVIVSSPLPPAAQTVPSSQVPVPEKTPAPALPPPVVQPQPEERFASVTVRRGIDTAPGTIITDSVFATIPPGRALGMVTHNEREFIATSVRVDELVETAYGIGMVGTRPHLFASVEGVPSWRERFDVNARSPRPIAESKGGQESAPMRAMLQQLLADRFQFVAHWEPREKVVYDLSREGPLGPRLVPSADCTVGKCVQVCAEVWQFCAGQSGYSGSTRSNTRSHLMVGNHLRSFIGNLELDLRRPVIDRTGLEGLYNLALEYSMGSSSFGRVVVSAIPPNDGWRSLSNALRDQLGLRLEPRIVQEEVLVIDRIALPNYDAP